MRAMLLLLAFAAAGCSGSAPAGPSTPTPVTPPVVTTPTPTPTPAPVRGPQFSQIFWDQFVHDTFDAPTAPAPLQRLTAAPMLFLKTVDEAGRAIDAITLQTVEDAVRGVALTWSGGQFGLAGVQRGPETRDGIAGWLTVKWLSTDAGNFCGRATTGIDGGFMELNYLHPTCSCGGASRVYPRLARHELGHTFGYWHTDSGSDVMYGQTITAALDCNLSPSAREVYHATLAYQTPIGSTLARPAGARLIID